MNSYLIRGGNALSGNVKISGAKNSALGLIAAAIMSDEQCTLENVPNVTDVKYLLKAIKYIGGEVNFENNILKINGGNINPKTPVCYEKLKKMRASYYLLGALLGKYGYAEVSLPGGCNIGVRPIDQHIKGFKALGAKIVLKNGNIIAKATKLKGTKIYFDNPSVGATINVMLAAVFAEGTTTLLNVAKEPHVVDVANLLSKMGAHINGAGSSEITIKGVEKLNKKIEYKVIPDQIEAGTFMCAAAITKGDIVIENVIPSHLRSISLKLKEIGCEIIESENSIRVIAKNRLNSTFISTGPHPEFPTDMQPQMAVVLGLSNGCSIVEENIFENRFIYVDELRRMGADVIVKDNIARINGIEEYLPADVTAPDLRAGAALVLAALSANGESKVYDIKYILRGYENFEQKLRNLGADISIIYVEEV
jgi:UDP-N-acetylglucosamine 1-carboxyvinyltransferase